MELLGIGTIVIVVILYILVYQIGKDFGYFV